MISVVIPYCENRPEKRDMLNRAVKSLHGYDELILVWNTIGMCKAVNIGCQLARGDYIIIFSDDAVLENGSLTDLIIPGTVTSPRIKQIAPQSFSGVVWCTPRTIYEKYGMWDESYADGIYYEDEDYWNTLRKEGIPHKCVENVVVSHEHGGSTLIYMPQREARIELNKQIFLKKWGRLP